MGTPVGAAVVALEESNNPAFLLIDRHIIQITPLFDYTDRFVNFVGVS